MRRYRKYLFLISSGIIVAIVAWKLYNPEGRGSDAGVPEQQQQQPSRLQLTGIHLVQYDGDVVRWDMRAERAIHQADDVVAVSQPDLTIYRRVDERNDGGDLSIAACGGRVEQETRAMTFSGAVHANDEQGHLLLTEQLHFDPKRQLLHTPSRFVLEGSKGRLSGVGLQLNPENRSVSVLKQVRIVIPKGWKSLV
ncbi:MAG: LPS export ABC transporter periplasmic protein LptC [Magnetococcales bacterium]|nr:LPS export ABC transporter periplasmic protein LptC [Magnetococcales bacterium]